MRILTLLMLSSIFICTYSQQPGKVLPPWKEGEMEIHHIYTGRGECVFCVFPDGTTMLIDAGDKGPHTDPRTTAGSPDETRRAGEWIARYLSKRLPFPKEKVIDYFFLTHFHSDHMGTINDKSPRTSRGGDYLLSGLTDVAEYLNFSKMVDRDWPEYNFSVPQDTSTFRNYLKFVKWSVANSGMKIERFIPGSNRQFTLIHKPEKYKGFEIRNIVSNGEVWTGTGEQTRKFFPGPFPEGDSDENICSAGIRISYGSFDYFNGGDLTGRLAKNEPAWKDIETPVGKAVGPVEVCEANHHSCWDAMNEAFIKSVRPKVYVVQVWHVTQLNNITIKSMKSQALYSGERYIIPTVIPEITRKEVGDEGIKELSGDGGHIIIKVEPGGKTYKVILLNEQDESMTVKSVFGPFRSE